MTVSYSGRRTVFHGVNYRLSIIVVHVRYRVFPNSCRNWNWNTLCT